MGRALFDTQLEGYIRYSESKILGDEKNLLVEGMSWSPWWYARIVSHRLGERV